MLHKVLCVVVLLVAQGFTDKPCAERQISGQSVVCVCNSTYCDELTRETPEEGTFVSYTSSESGLRFQKGIGSLSESNETGNNTGSCGYSLTLDTSTVFQTIEGFGGATTDAAGINWKNLTDATLQQILIDSYYSKSGLEYSMARVPIGGTDFSTHPYAYNELPKDDVKLANFSLAYEDFEYKIPMLKAILAAATKPVHLVATTWSPPAWMKTNDQYTGFSRLKPEYYQTYADYHVKFLEKYTAEGIPIWGITTTNEPINGVFNLASFNSLGWSPSDMGSWIVNNLGPTIRNSTFKDLKIITLDDQRVTIPVWFNLMIKKYPEALQYIDGVGVHYYTDKFVPASVLSLISNSHPDKFILATEACEGSAPWQTEKVILGSWTRAKSYIVDIIADLNYNVIGWLDWNLCLNDQGGPNWVKNYVDSPIIVYPEKNEFIKQPMYYAMGHFSKFVPRGSRRIKSTEKKSLLSSSLDNVAFITPYNTVVVVVYNGGGQRDICIKLGKTKATVSLASKSVVTVEIPIEQ
ncbi:lysosomal acid glucosylceramidase-like [Ostrinia nubilalis]|uniref:lysosomal acid glucosylceramidase-like n=1 Tax=Ostrinia nubilalis TaxID=29057 RepID=UPI0030822694